MPFVLDEPTGTGFVPDEPTGTGFVPDTPWPETFQQIPEINSAMGGLTAAKKILGLRAPKMVEAAAADVSTIPRGLIENAPTIALNAAKKAATVIPEQVAALLSNIPKFQFLPENEKHANIRAEEEGNKAIYEANKKIPTEYLETTKGFKPFSDKQIHELNQAKLTNQWNEDPNNKAMNFFKFFSGPVALAATAMEFKNKIDLGIDEKTAAKDAGGDLGVLGLFKGAERLLHIGKDTKGKDLIWQPPKAVKDILSEIDATPQEIINIWNDAYGKNPELLKQISKLSDEEKAILLKDAITKVKANPSETAPIPAQKVSTPVIEEPTIETSPSQKLISDLHPDVNLTTLEDGGNIELTHIAVPKELQMQGKGGAALDSLVKYGDDTQQTITVTPGTELGADKKRIENFYTSRGFVPNEDESLRGSYIKYPATKDTAQQFQGPEITNTRPGFVGQRDTFNPAKEPSQLGSFLKKQLKTEGTFPKPIFDRLMERDRFVAEQMQQAGFAIADVKRTIAPIVNEIPKAQRKAFLFKVNEQLQGVETDLPDNIKESIQPIRNHIDSLTEQLIQVGAAKGEMADKLRSNIKTYLHRSYRIHEEANWRNVIPTQIQKDAFEWLQRDNPDLSDEEIKGLFDSLLVVEEPGVIKPGKAGSANKDIFKGRKDIPPEIRALWGEYKDFDVNALKTITKMAELVASHKFLTQIMEDGAGIYFFKKPIEVNGISYSYPFRGNPYQKPIENVDDSLQPNYKGEMYTSKEIYDAFQNYYASDSPPKWLGLYFKAIYMTKFGKVILSPKANIRNFTGNFLMIVFNGNYDMTQARLAFKTARDSFTLNGTKESRDYILKLTKLGILEEGVTVGELKGMMKDVNLSSLDTFLGHAMNKAIRTVGEGAAKLYALEDAFFKIIAFECEKKRYGWAQPELTQEELEAKCAEIVRKTMPTYSELPRLVTHIRRFPFFGPFASFLAALIKSSINNVSIAAKEMLDTNPRLRSIGAQRLAGMMAAIGITTAIGFISANNRKDKITKEEEEAYRLFMPDWAKNSNVLWLKKEGDRINYINLGYTDPYQNFKEVYGTILRGTDPTDKTVSALQQFFSPFISEDILTGALMDILRNHTKDDRSIWIESDLPGDKTMKAMAYVMNKAQPEPTAFAQNLYKAFTDKGENTYGQKKDWKQVITSEFTGTNISNVNPLVQFKFITSTYLKNAQDVKFIKDPEERAAADVRLFEDYRRYYDALQTLGIPKGKVLSLMSMSRVPQEVVAGMLGVDYANIVKVKEQASQIKRGVNKGILKEILQ